jgi:hypothetical protein
MLLSKVISKVIFRKYADLEEGDTVTVVGSDEVELNTNWKIFSRGKGHTVIKGFIVEVPMYQLSKGGKLLEECVPYPLNGINQFLKWSRKKRDKPKPHKIRREQIQDVEGSLTLSEIEKIGSNIENVLRQRLGQDLQTQMRKNK